MELKSHLHITASYLADTCVSINTPQPHEGAVHGVKGTLGKCGHTDINVFPSLENNPSQEHATQGSHKPLKMYEMQSNFASELKTSLPLGCRSN